MKCLCCGNGIALSDQGLTWGPHGTTYCGENCRRDYMLFLIETSIARLIPGEDS